MTLLRMAKFKSIIVNREQLQTKWMLYVQYIAQNQFWLYKFKCNLFLIRDIKNPDLKESSIKICARWYLEISPRFLKNI